MDLYKIVGPNGECLNGGSGKWSLPVGDQPGEWWTIDGPLQACGNGLHLATAEQVPHWYRAGSGAVVYRVEVDDWRPLVDAGDKWVAGRVRLLPRKSRGAADMAKAAALRTRRVRAAERKLAAVKRTAVVPDQWRAYLHAIGGAKLPASHPGAQYQAAYAADEARVREAMGAATAAINAAHRAYDAAALAEVMPA